MIICLFINYKAKSKQTWGLKFEKVNLKYLTLYISLKNGIWLIWKDQELSWTSWLQQEFMKVKQYWTWNCKHLWKLRSHVRPKFVHKKCTLKKYRYHKLSSASNFNRYMAPIWKGVSLILFVLVGENDMWVLGLLSFAFIEELGYNHFPFSSLCNW